VYLNVEPLPRGAGFEFVDSFRDMHAVTQHIQARDDHYERVGRYLLGLEPDRGWL
jgi:hypothetical protein